MFDCYTSSHSVYFDSGFNPFFREQYKGVIVNARSEGGYGHFAIRKPITFWFKLPKFIKKMFPYRWIMWKNDREKMYELCFDDPYKSIIIVADMKNPSYQQLTFDKETYEDLKENIPVFLEKIGFKFKVEKDDCCTTLIFD